MGDLATLPTFQAAPTGYSHTDFNAVFSALTIANSAVTTNKILDGAVTFAKIVTIATATLLGRSTAGTGVVESITLGTSMAMAAGVLNTIQGIRTTDSPTFAAVTATTFTGTHNGNVTGGTISGTTGSFSSNVGVGAAPIAAVQVGITYNHATTDGLKFVDTNGAPFASWTVGMGAGGADGFGFYHASTGRQAFVTSTGLNSTVIGATTPAAGTFTTLAASTYVTGTGTNPGGLGGSRWVYDWFSGNHRQFSYGADASTNGAWTWITQRSDGSNSVMPMSLTSTGLAVTGALSASSSITSASVAKLGAGFAGFAEFSDTSRFGAAGTYSFLSETGGTGTYVNASSGGSVFLRIANSDRAVVSGTGFSVTGIVAVSSDITQVGSYHNFTATQGSTGYGIRNNAGVMEFKNNGGSWASFSTGGTGTVTSVSVVTANGVSGSVATATTTPAITITLAAITPTTIAMSGALSGATTISMSSTLSGGTTCDFTTSYKVNGTKVLGTQGAAVTDLSLTVAGFTTDSGTHASNYSAIQSQVNLILARIRASTGHGLIA